MHTMTRTNVDIDDELIDRVMKRYFLRTKREAVDLALRTLAGSTRQRREMLDMVGTGWEGDLDEMRQARVPEGPVDR